MAKVERPVSDTEAARALDDRRRELPSQAPSGTGEGGNRGAAQLMSPLPARSRRAGERKKLADLEMSLTIGETPAWHVR